MTKWRVMVLAAAMAGGAAGGVMADDQPRDLDTHHIFSAPAERTAWEARRKELREQILFSAGLLPMPAKTPLHPLVTGKYEGPDFTIENVALETRPGFYLCGNLYRPKGKHGPFPAIVNPHGHWEHGRMEMQPDVERADPSGKMGAGRGNLVAIGVNLARQGIICFAYDMVGYNDTSQLDHRKFAGSLRPWLWNISELGLQTWNSIRVVDYLESLPDVDKRRIGVTGASGGGTQTFVLCAIEDRVAAAVPVNMISAYMQGGCLCENGPGLRVDTDNVEIGAMMAPRPLLLVAATGDWTKNVPTEEWPAIKRVYDLYDAGDKTAAVQFNYQHNYNVESREAMYAFFGKYLTNTTDPTKLKEQPFTLDVNVLKVWNSAHPMPANALKEPELTTAMMADSEKQLASVWPKSIGGVGRFREAYAPALQRALAWDPPAQTQATGGSRQQVLLVSMEGDQRAARLKGQLEAQKLQVTSLVLSEPNRSVDYWAAFYTCYNRTAAQERAGKVADAVYSLRGGDSSAKIHIVGIGDAGLYALLGRALVQEAGKTVVDVARFDNTNDEEFLKRLYAPGLRRAGDLRTAAMLVAPSSLCLYNTAGRFESQAVQSGFAAARGKLRFEQAELTDKQIVDFVTGK